MAPSPFDLSLSFLLWESLSEHGSATFRLLFCGLILNDILEPLPNIRDGILVERLVKTMRYVADVRRCQYVVQRPEGVRRRQRLNVEYVDRRSIRWPLDSTGSAS